LCAVCANISSSIRLARNPGWQLSVNSLLAEMARI